jgi:hypothetical protein
MLRCENALIVEENDGVVWEWIVVYRDGIFPRISLIYAERNGKNENTEGMNGKKE